MERTTSRRDIFTTKPLHTKTPNKKSSMKPEQRPPTEEDDDDDDRYEDLRDADGSSKLQRLGRGGGSSGGGSAGHHNLDSISESGTDDAGSRGTSDDDGNGHTQNLKDQVAKQTQQTLARKETKAGTSTRLYCRLAMCACVCVACRSDGVVVECRQRTIPMDRRRAVWMDGWMEGGREGRIGRQSKGAVGGKVPYPRDGRKSGIWR